MYTWEELRDKVNLFIDNLKFEREPCELYAPIRYTLEQSGKRVRPVLFLMAYNLYKESVEDALYPAVAMETYHNYTLIHDDVMDRADIRRGKPTVCAKWGDVPAILSGDTMLVLAYEFLAHVPTEKLPSMLALFTETAKQIGDGQQYDIEFETRDNVAEDEYLEMIRLKTSVLLATALQMGAYIAGADEQAQDALYQFGIHIGLAFQIQDDILDVWGDPATFGKAIGGDIACNKKTFVTLTALQMADEESRHALHTWLNQTLQDNAQKIAEVTAIYDRLAVRTECEKQVMKLTQLALAHLDVLPQNEATDELRKLAEKLYTRNS